MMPAKKGICNKSKGEAGRRQLFVSLPAVDKEQKVPTSELSEELEVTQVSDVEEVTAKVENVTLAESSTDSQFSPEIVKDLIQEESTVDDEEKLVPEKAAEPTPTDNKNQPSTKNEHTIEYVVCPDCGKSIPAANFIMHQAHCARMQALKRAKQEFETAEKSKQQNAAKSSAKKGKGKKKNKKSAQENQDDDDDDKLLAEAMSSANKCSFPSCKVRVSMIAHVCSICRRTFCLEHSMPELHGCGKPKKTNKAVPVCHNGVLHQVSRNKDKLSDSKRKLVKKKLDQQIKTLEKSRKTAAGKSSKKN